jgi:hypothetical protein
MVMDTDLDFLPILGPWVKKECERMCSFAQINRSARPGLKKLRYTISEYRYLVGFCLGRHAAESAASSCGRRRPPHRWAAPGPPVRSASLYQRRHRRQAAGTPRPRWRSRLRRAGAAWRCVRRAARPQSPPACRVGNKKTHPKKTQNTHLKNPTKNVFFYVLIF